MSRLLAFLWTVTSLAAATTVSPPANGATAPLWSDSYSVTGTIFIPFAEVEEPFSAWIDTQVRTMDLVLRTNFVS
jgi:hypothetical protein